LSEVVDRSLAAGRRESAAALVAGRSAKKVPSASFISIRRPIDSGERRHPRSLAWDVASLGREFFRVIREHSGDPRGSSSIAQLSRLELGKTVARVVTSLA
jgi:hypothetical protein